MSIVIETKKDFDDFLKFLDRYEKYANEWIIHIKNRSFARQLIDRVPRSRFIFHTECITEEFNEFLDDLLEYFEEQNYDDPCIRVRFNEKYLTLPDGIKESNIEI